MNKTTISLFLCFTLYGCKGSNNSEDINSTPPIVFDSAAALSTFSSVVKGNYPLLTNAKIADLIVSYPIIASFPDIIRLEQKKQWEGFINESKTLGFDKEQFDVIYQMTSSVIQLLKNAATEDISLGMLIAEPPPAYLSLIEISKDIDLGTNGKNKKYMYTLHGAASHPSCSRSDGSCELTIDIELIIDLPTMPVSFSPSEDYIGVTVRNMEIRFSRFKISNSLASLELHSEGSAAFDLYYSHEMTKVDNPQDGLQSADKTPNKLPANTIMPSSGIPSFGGIIKSDAFSSVQTSWAEKESSANIFGSFTNTFSSENGQEKTFTLKGRAVGNLGFFNFVRNYSREGLTWPLFTQFEIDNNFDPKTTFEIGTVSGYIEDADLNVAFYSEYLD